MKKKCIHSSFENQSQLLEKTVADFDTIGSVFGNQNRNTIRVVSFGDLSLNIKSFKAPGLIKKIIYGNFRKTKAERSYNYANNLLDKNIGTPKPIAYFENFDTLGLTTSFYISEHLEVDLTFRELVEQPNFPDHELILRQFVRFTHKLHEAEILFKDHSPGNTLIKKEQNQYYFYLVDLNRMDFKSLSFKERMGNFSRLTPKKEMIAVMSDEYAQITGMDYELVFMEMWKQTSKFQEKFFRKRRLKKKLFFWRK
ncbi:lipopolysaccharide kinase InaA family protein [Aquimarina agarilytica]|uniref:lipopolysaccharide kinase InaA family protein n=1 Tax=Aquimarina agarilytica TaxID=1087449 RepID=UPI0002891953|nr:lipopolysaccharide kinase InaA family protein [Aquimarina agarilytica]